MTDLAFNKKYEGCDFAYKVFRDMFTASCHFPEQAIEKTSFKGLKRAFSKVNVNSFSIMDFVYESKNMKIDSKIISNAFYLYRLLISEE